MLVYVLIWCAAFSVGTCFGVMVSAMLAASANADLHDEIYRLKRIKPYLSDHGRTSGQNVSTYC